MTDGRSARQRRLQAKRDPIEWHGHRIVTETDLGAVFGEDDVERRRRASRRRVRHGVVLALLVVILFAAVYVALGIARGDISVGEPEAAAPSPTSTCPAGPFDYQDPSAITVNVYNGTTISGLASTAATQLRERAFAVRDIGNRELASTAATAFIISGEGGRANAFTVQRTIPDSIYVADEREDRTVDVVLGESYAGIVPPEGVDITPAGLTCAPEEGATTAPAPTAEPTAP